MAKSKAAIQREVTVDEEPCLVWVGQQSARLYLAYGDFRGKRIDVTGMDVSHALSQWKRMAEVAANE